MPKINVESCSLYEMIDYLMDKTNIGASAYDADAIACMNRLFIELKKDARKFNVHNGTEVQ